MRSTKPVRRSWALAPLVLALAGCGENNETRVQASGATTAPEAAASTEDALKAAPAPATPNTTSKNYPGAGRRP